MEVNFLAIGLAGLAAWALGALWYSPALFAKAWQAELGITEESMKGANMPLIFGLSFVLMCVMAFGLSFVINAHPEIAVTHGAFHGMMTGLMFAATSIGINYLYQRRSVKLYLIDGVYQVLFLAVMGAILAAFS